MLHYLCVGLGITITQSHMHTVQQTCTHKAVTRRIEAKKLLSRRRQSEYRNELVLLSLYFVYNTQYHSYKILSFCNEAGKVSLNTGSTVKVGIFARIYFCDVMICRERVKI